MQGIVIRRCIARTTNSRRPTRIARRTYHVSSIRAKESFFSSVINKTVKMATGAVTDAVKDTVETAGIVRNVVGDAVQKPLDLIQGVAEKPPLLIGRDKELRYLGEMVNENDATSVNFIHGPKGQGKSTLLKGALWGRKRVIKISFGESSPSNVDELYRILQQTFNPYSVEATGESLKVTLGRILPKVSLKFIDISIGGEKTKYEKSDLTGLLKGLEVLFESDKEFKPVIVIDNFENASDLDSSVLDDFMKWMVNVANAGKAHFILISDSDYFFYNLRRKATYGQDLFGICVGDLPITATLEFVEHNRDMVSMNESQVSSVTRVFGGRVGHLKTFLKFLKRLGASFDKKASWRTLEPVHNRVSEAYNPKQFYSLYTEARPQWTPGQWQRVMQMFVERDFAFIPEKEMRSVIRAFNKRDPIGSMLECGLICYRVAQSLSGELQQDTPGFVPTSPGAYWTMAECLEKKPYPMQLLRVSIRGENYHQQVPIQEISYDGVSHAIASRFGRQPEDIITMEKKLNNQLLSDDDDMIELDWWDNVVVTFAEPDGVSDDKEE